MQIVIVRSKSFLLLSNTCLKEQDLKIQRKTYSKGLKKRNNFIKPGLKIASPIVSAGVATKTKKPQSAQLTSNILKSLTGVKKLGPTGMHSRCLRIKVM